MSWLFSRALVEEFSGDTSSDGEPSALLSVMPTPHKFWRNDKTMEPSDLSRFGLTCAVLTEDRGEALLMLYREGFLAKTSAAPGKVPAWPAGDLECGSKWPESLTRFDPALYSWRTPQCSLLEGLEEFSEIWPRWGLMRNGECWQRVTWARSTSANESGLWPTPTVCGNYNRPGASATSGMGLASAVKLYPTPTAGSKQAGGSLSEWGGSGSRKKFSSMVPHADLYGPLNPMWVEWLMGWPTGWTDLKPLGTDKFQEWQRQHSPRSQPNSTKEAA